MVDDRPLHPGFDVQCRVCGGSVPNVYAVSTKAALDGEGVCVPCKTGVPAEAVAEPEAEADEAETAAAEDVGDVTAAETVEAGQPPSSEAGTTGEPSVQPEAAAEPAAEGEPAGEGEAAGPAAEVAP